MAIDGILSMVKHGKNKCIWLISAAVLNYNKSIVYSMYYGIINLACYYMELILLMYRHVYSTGSWCRRDEIDSAKNKLSASRSRSLGSVHDHIVCISSSVGDTGHYHNSKCVGYIIITFSSSLSSSQSIPLIHYYYSYYSYCNEQLCQGHVHVYTCMTIRLFCLKFLVEVISCSVTILTEYSFLKKTFNQYFQKFITSIYLGKSIIIKQNNGIRHTFCNMYNHNN